MNTQFLSVLSSKGQLTIPKQLREALQIKEGQTLFLALKGSNIIQMRKAKIELEDDYSDTEWEKLRKIAKQGGKKYSSSQKFIKSLKL